MPELTEGAPVGGAPTFDAGHGRRVERVRLRAVAALARAHALTCFGRGLFHNASVWLAPVPGKRAGAAPGSLVLSNVIRVAVMSSPLPFGWGQPPPLLLALHWPYALIGPVCVGGALFGHVVLTRALLRGRGLAVSG